MTKRTLSLILAIILILLPSSALAATVDTLQTYQREPDLLFYIDTYNFIQNNYPFEVEDSQLIESSIKGMLQNLDPYSDYYTPEEAAEIYESLLGDFTGIGVYIEEKNSYINIVGTIPNSPGEQAGLKENDLIVSINGEDIKDYSVNKAQDLIRGEEGTKVKLGILRENKTEPLYIDVVRKNIIINPVEYEIIDEEIGYINLFEFTDYATQGVKNALKAFDEKGIKKVILDLRNNPGGLLDQAIEVSRLFVPKGPVVHIKEKNKDLVTHISTNDNPKYDLVLLVNEYSASASEIVAGAIKDTKAGTIIGNKTFGKGIVQSLIPLQNGGMIKMTTAEYLTPNKTSIHGTGIMPDIEVTNTSTEDLQLKKAIDILN